MRLLMKIILLPLFPAVVLLDVIMWPIIFRRGKIDMRESIKEVWSAWRSL